MTAPGEKFEPGYFVDVVRQFPQVQSVHWSINDTPSEVTNLPTRLLSGEEWIEEELAGLRFRVRPNAFLQTNTAMAERLYALAREAAQLSGGETVWDLYCGIGTIGLSLAGDALTVWGIEISEESVACALENAELNGITNAAFFAGNVGQVVEDLLDRSGPPDVVVVDPPRAGLAGVRSSLARSARRRSVAMIDHASKKRAIGFRRFRFPQHRVRAAAATVTAKLVSGSYGGRNAAFTARSVISLKVILKIFFLSTPSSWARCQPMASPSRSGSVAMYRVPTFSAAFLSSSSTFFFAGRTR